MRGLLYSTPRTPSRPTYGGQVAKIAAAVGTPLMPHQRHILDVALEVLPDGSWAFPDVVETVQRQQGKTAKDGPTGMHRVITRKRARCWVTAQTRQDARDNVIDDFGPMWESSILGPLATVRRSQGSEGLYRRKAGSFLRVFAPGEEAVHGKANELVTVDEGWAFTLLEGRALDQAIGPTFLTTGGQYFRHSTAGTDASQWLKADVDRGRAAAKAGLTEGLAYFEFGLPDELEDSVREGLEQGVDTPEWTAAVQTLIDHMPAKGYTLKDRVVFSEARKMDPGGILRAYGNKWTRTLEHVIPTDAWRAARRDALPRPTVPVAFAFVCMPDRSRAAIVAAWREPNDPTARWRVIDERPGTGWVVDRMAALIDERTPAAVGYDRYGPATDIGDALERRGYQLRTVTYAEMATASIATLAAVAEGELVFVAHPALDPMPELAAKKQLGTRWVWDLMASAGSIAALVAGTIATWVFDHPDSTGEDIDVRLAGD